MKKTIFLFFAIVFIPFQSCKKKVVEDGNHSHTFLIYSFLSPEQPSTLVSVKLIDPTEGILGGYTVVELPEKPTVIISVNLKSYTLSYNQQLNSFVIDSSQLQIVRGATYTLSVTATDGTSATAQTTIPEATNSFTNTYIKDTTNFGYVLNSSWQDSPDSNSYYELSVSFVNHQTMQLASNSVVFSDWKKLGGIITEKLPFEYDPTQSETVTVQLYTYSPAYNDFYKNNNHRTLTQGNISNGFGYFSGKTITKVQVLP